MIAYKLFRRRRDGSLGSLFINRRRRLPVGEWMRAESYPTRGFAVRPGWHAMKRPAAPHLSERGRVWCRVSLRSAREYHRPRVQGGAWLLAGQLKILEVLG